MTLVDDRRQACGNSCARKQNCEVKMINNNYEYKSCKKWAVAFYVLFMLNLILAGIMLGIMDIAKLGAVWLFAGVFLACSIVSLVVFCVILHEMSIYVESQKRYYVDKKDFDFLVNSFGFYDECEFLERCIFVENVSYLLKINAITGEMFCVVGDCEFHDVKKFVSDLAKFGLLRVMQPVL